MASSYEASSTGSRVALRDAGCMATFSLYHPHPRVVSRESQASVAVNDRAVQARPAVTGTRSLSTTTAGLISTSEAASLCPQGLGLVDAEVQTEEFVHAGCGLYDDASRGSSIVGGISGCHG